jgi:hypothetical protein
VALAGGAGEQLGQRFFQGADCLQGRHGGVRRSGECAGCFGGKK